MICENGYFCERMILMAKRLKLDVLTINVKWGTAVDPAQVEKILKQHNDVKMVSDIFDEPLTKIWLESTIINLVKVQKIAVK